MALGGSRCRHSLLLYPQTPGEEGLLKLLGGKLIGVFSTDRWSAYASRVNRLRQICWAHLIRDFQKLIDRGGREGRREAGRKTQRAGFLDLPGLEGDDMALLKIEPYEGMPVFGELDLSDREIAQGTEVRLFGFPLGRNILSGKDEKLAASVFSGIVSRKVDPYFQIQAAVYPGNSGGPVVDESGRVLGIVTSVQTTSTGQIASDIGFVIPIARAKGIWPPAK